MVAFAAIAVGATALKLFPAEAASPAILRAHRAVLPADLSVIAIGIQVDGMAAWRKAGVQRFGPGSSPYAAGDDVAPVRGRAEAFVAATASPAGG